MDKMKRKKLAAILSTIAAVINLVLFASIVADNYGIVSILIMLLATFMLIFSSIICWTNYAKLYIDHAIQQKLNENQKGDSDA